MCIYVYTRYSPGPSCEQTQVSCVVETLVTLTRPSVYTVHYIPTCPPSVTTPLPSAVPVLRGPFPRESFQNTVNARRTRFRYRPTVQVHNVHVFNDYFFITYVPMIIGIPVSVRCRRGMIHEPRNVVTRSFRSVPDDSKSEMFVHPLVTLMYFESSWSITVVIRPFKL